ncbi:MAG: prepilin-type N-terminal cleavage/methylation domain-containing protein [Pseudomonadota bacterium]
MPDSRGRGPWSRSGFSLVELLAVLAIIGFLVAVAAPASVGFYRNTQERQAIRETMQVLASARERAMTGAQIVDVRVYPQQKRIETDRGTYRYPDSVSLVGRGSRELNEEQAAVIRFYPDGSSSGGGVDIQRSAGAVTHVDVDWLLGRISQSRDAGSS